MPIARYYPRVLTIWTVTLVTIIGNFNQSRTSRFHLRMRQLVANLTPIVVWPAAPTSICTNGVIGGHPSEAMTVQNIPNNLGADGWMSATAVEALLLSGLATILI